MEILIITNDTSQILTPVMLLWSMICDPTNSLAKFVATGRIQLYQLFVTSFIDYFNEMYSVSCLLSWSGLIFLDWEEDNGFNLLLKRRSFRLHSS